MELQSNEVCQPRIDMTGGIHLRGLQLKRLSGSDSCLALRENLAPFRSL